MKRLVLPAFLLLGLVGVAQVKRASDEAFLNSILNLVMDNHNGYFYLCTTAAPCSFKHFDYDEWYTYALQEDVPVYILNELSHNAALDQIPYVWNEKCLSKAVCIDEDQAKSILSSSFKQAGKTNRRDKPASLVYYCSRPVFTADGQYAIMDISMRCDDRQCGSGATVLFRQTGGTWHIAGRKIVWGN